jgi:hypothetical protein
MDFFRCLYTSLNYEFLQKRPLVISSQHNKSSCLNHKGHNNKINIKKNNVYG